MDFNKFILELKNINFALPDKKVEKAWHSIGGNIFFDFGDILSTYINRRGETRSLWEWGIHIGNSAWRLTKDKRFLVGSESYVEDIEKKIQGLLSKKFVSIEIVSQFLDLEINFEEGYQIQTFFFWEADDQWWLAVPNKASSPPHNEYLSVDCETPEQIRDVLELSLRLPSRDNYEPLTDVLDGKLIKRIFLEKDRIFMTCEDRWYFAIDMWRWRLEKGGGYELGSFRADSSDEELAKRLQVLVGERIKRVDAANDKNDLRIQIGDHYVLKTFTSSEWDHWFIDSKKDTILSWAVQTVDN